MQRLTGDNAAVTRCSIAGYSKQWVLRAYLVYGGDAKKGGTLFEGTCSGIGSSWQKTAQEKGASGSKSEGELVGRASHFAY
jgi:hypothetical protein